MLKRVRHLLSQDEWFLAVAPRAQRALFKEDPRAFQVLAAPRGHFYADPFLFVRDGVTYLFFEDYDHDAGKGTIACLQQKSDGLWADAQTVLKRDYHLSYPCVFADGDEIFMVPETSANRTIELYRAATFPQRWELDTVLMRDVRAADTTLYRAPEGRWWMFTSLAEKEDSPLGPLHLFAADSPRGPWVPHRVDPVIQDGSRTRSAGALFRHEGNLYRPSQDCSVEYGQAVIINRVDELSGNAYRETPVARITAATVEGALRVHTFNCNHELEVRDGFRLTRRTNWREAVWRRLGSRR